MTQDHSSVIWGPHLVGDEPEDGRTIDVVMSEIERDVMTEFLSRPPIFVVPSWVYRKIALIRDPAKVVRLHKMHRDYRRKGRR